MLKSVRRIVVVRRRGKARTQERDTTTDRRIVHPSDDSTRAEIIDDRGCLSICPDLENVVQLGSARHPEQWNGRYLLGWESFESWALDGQ